MRYPFRMEEEIINHEKKMLHLYSQIIRKEYEAFFKEFGGYTLKIGEEWQYLHKNVCSYSRLKFTSGYFCAVYCEVQKDGKLVEIKSYDGEVDYYPLFATWEITRIESWWIKPPYLLFDDTSDIQEDMNELVEILIESKNTL